MIYFIKNIPSFLRILYLLSKYRIIIDNNLPLPVHFRFLAYCISFIFYPKNLFIASKGTFGRRLSLVLQSMGPIYIKFGQSLSTRPDLIGFELAEELKYLQDQLPLFSFDVVELLQSQFKRPISDIFTELQTIPVAVASIAQVHKAKLITGASVAVKILRPGITAIYEKDIQILENSALLLTSIAKRLVRLKLHEVIAVFKQSMKTELNLKLEAAAAASIRDNCIDDNNLYIPQVYWNLTTENILTLEWIDGFSIYDKECILHHGMCPKEIAAKIAVIFFNQAYRDGFFHADLHPGNIRVLRDGKIALIDFGIIGVLPQRDRLAIAEILYGFLNKNYQLVAEVHYRAGYIPKNTNLVYFAQSCRSIAEPIINLAAKDISIGCLLGQLFKITEEYGMETQPQLLLLQKTMVVVEGVGKILATDINMWQLAEPWIKIWAIKHISPEAKLLRYIKQWIKKHLDIHINMETK